VRFPRRGRRRRIVARWQRDCAKLEAHDEHETFAAGELALVG
jgi:hypothetical protein